MTITPEFLVQNFKIVIERYEFLLAHFDTIAEYYEECENVETDKIMDSYNRSLQCLREEYYMNPREWIANRILELEHTIIQLENSMDIDMHNNYTKSLEEVVEQLGSIAYNHTKQYRSQQKPNM